MVGIIGEQRSYVAGDWVTGTETMPVESPADESNVTDLTVTPLGDIERAVIDARRAFDDGGSLRLHFIPLSMNAAEAALMERTSWDIYFSAGCRRRDSKRCRLRLLPSSRTGRGRESARP